MDYIYREEEADNVYANLENSTQENIYQTLNLNTNPFRKDWDDSLFLEKQGAKV